MFGTYEIDDNGDTTLTDYGAYRVKDGKLVFDRVIKAQPVRNRIASDVAGGWSFQPPAMR